MDFSTLGDSLVSRDGDVAVDSLKDLEYIGIYFSAHWCPPCRKFTPELAKFYTELRDTAIGKKMNIVFVSFDRDPKQFEEYFAEMPWLAIPFSANDVREDLSTKYGVSGIPQLLMVNCKTGHVLKEGRAKVDNNAPFPWN